MRAEGWPERMNAEIERLRSEPFVWGQCDCCLFSADVAMAICGIDYASEFRGKYSSKSTAARALRTFGQGTIEKAMDSRLSRINFPRRGDVVMAVVNDGPALGICIGPYCVFKGLTGIVKINLDAIMHAWAID